MSMSGGRDDGEPMMEMNTTPLIDVMLVLLIMFLITIPVQTHAVKVDLPQNDHNALQNAIETDTNKISIDPAGVVTRRSEENTSELTTLMRISYRVLTLKNKKEI